MEDHKNYNDSLIMEQLEHFQDPKQKQPIHKYSRSIDISDLQQSSNKKNTKIH